MYRYMPPKSSVWGHSLRRLRPAEAKARFGRFLAAAAGEHHPTGGNVFYQPTTETLFDHSRRDRCTAHFTRLLGLEDDPRWLSNLDSRQVELCLEELIRDDSLFVPGGDGAVVLAGVRISSWRMGDREVPTDSHIHVYYGACSRISTALTFNDLDEFSFVRQVLEEVVLCRLNEKHLKGKAERPR